MYKFGLIGCGRIGKRHAEILSSGQVEGAVLSAVCDIDPTRAEAFGHKYRVPAHHTIEAMLADPSVDVVSIATPSGLHADHATAAAVAGRHVVVEKPMALRLQDADRMIAACDKAGVKLFVVKQNRFNLPVIKLREAITAGRFGRLVLGTIRVRWCRDQTYYDGDAWRGTWAQDGGVLANQASHHVDLLEWMMGEVDSVFARGITALVDVETEDTAVATIKFRNGALGVIEATTAARPKDMEGSISILGALGAVEIAGFAVNSLRTWQFSEPMPGDDDVKQKYSVNPPSVYGFGHVAYYAHVVECLQQRVAALVDGLEGRKSLELISALYESMETEREVRLRFSPQHCRLGNG